MNENELDHMLKRAAIPGAMTGVSLGSEVMARVRVDEGRAKRWRSFVLWLLILAAISGVVTAGMIGWSMALKDTTHTTPPTMNLFREDAKP